MTVQQLGANAKIAAHALAVSSGAQRNSALQAMAQTLEQQQAAILAANALDLEVARQHNMSPSLQDRLRLTPERIAGMHQGILEIKSDADPLGQVLGGNVRPNGLRIEQVSVPLGVIGVIYEARPNVTADAAALCIKSGNAVILRGGKEAIHSNTAIAKVLRNAVASVGLPINCVQLVADTSRQSANDLMQSTGLVDVLIPRGGAGLIKAVVENARVPVIETGAGVCHCYLDSICSIDMALDIVENAKCSRPSVCNALETLLINRAVAAEFLPQLAARLPQVELRCDDTALQYLPNGVTATAADWATEYGELILSVKVVQTIDEALFHIAQYSTRHSECIVTNDYAASQRFLREVDAAAVYVNASTRFTDGGEFGFGAEIGIATQKLHARGPLGLRHLTSYKYMIFGEGQIR
jgi:glutamate-5-semialdehyde dehydrogenase